MKKNITILYVDESEFIRDKVIDYLSLSYINVWEAETGEEALKLYYEYRPDVIITEIELPIINGLDLVKYIRQRDKKTAIIFVTALTNIELIIESVELQLVKYVLKPLTNYKLDIALNLANQCLEERGNTSLIELSKNAYFNKLNYTLLIENNTTYLTSNEVLLLSLLVEKSNLVVTYKEIKCKIWNYEIGYKDSLRSLIYSLRKKLKYISIKNISGIGYSILL